MDIALKAGIAIALAAVLTQVVGTAAAQFKPSRTETSAPEAMHHRRAVSHIGWATAPRTD
jgi:hypothetical protein